VRVSFRFPATLASEATRAIRRRSIMLAVVGIVVLPMAWRGPSCGQDFDFHLQNWLEVVHSWHQGLFYPRWAASPNFLAGEPRFVFYPPLSRLLGGALGSVLPWAWTPLAFILLALFGAAWSFRAMAREWAGGDNAAAAACLYVLNPYMMFVLYERGALAELLAAVWMPLLVLFGLRRAPSLVPLALTIAALWLTNAPAGVMGCYLLAVIVAVAAIRQRSWTLVLRSLGAVPLGLGLSGFWLVPAVWQQRWVQIDRAIGPLMRVQDSFLFGHGSIAGVPATPDELFDLHYHNQVLRVASWIVVSLLLAAVAAAVLSWRRRSALWLPLVVAAALVGALQFPCTDFVWRHLPSLQFLQFPWRWMLVLGMIFAALAALALRPQPPTRRGLALRALVLLALAGASAAFSSMLFYQVCDDDNVQTQIAAFRSSGFEGTDEYTLQGVDLDTGSEFSPSDGTTRPVTVLEAPGADLTDQGRIPARVKIERWNVEHMTALVTTPQPAYAVLRLMDYPAWRVTLNGAVAQGRVQRSDGLIAIPVKPGVNRIDVRWRTTADQWAGIALSSAALVILVVLLGRLSGRRRGFSLPS